jgi:Fe-S-cluster-containing dehydrogenase component
MTRLGMVIDLAKCNGCGACAFACKAENNTRTAVTAEPQLGRLHDEDRGHLPERDHTLVMPVLCNHCSDAPCIKICPGNPPNPTKDPNGKPWKAMYKTPEGITLHDPELCIGCGDCQKACPYSHEKLARAAWTAALQRDQPQPADEEPAAALGRQDFRHPRLHARAPKSRPWPAPCRPC